MRTQKEGNALARSVILLLVIFVVTAAPTAIPNAARTSAEIKVTITVLPFAEANLDSNAIVALPEGGGNSQSAFVRGDVTTNCPGRLFADIEPPAGAPGNWPAATDKKDARIKRKGERMHASPKGLKEVMKGQNKGFGQCPGESGRVPSGPR